MQRLNSFYARQRFGEARGAPDEFVSAGDIERLQVLAPRYRLIKRSLLRDFEGVAVELDEVIESKDMTPEEVERWPALRQLRASREYAEWRNRSDSLRRPVA